MERKWTMFCFNPSDYKGLEAYLNRQADKGWELEKLTGLFARWRKTERPSKWCVDLLNPRADREEKLDYLDLCAEGGWELVALQGSVCIFRAEQGRDPFPVQTDPELEKKNYNRYYLRPAILSVAYIVVLIAVIALSALTNDRVGVSALKELRYGWLEHWTVAAFYLALPVWALMAVWKIFHFLSSLVRNRRKISAPSVEAMWIHSVLVLFSTILGVLVLAALAADKVFGTLESLYLFMLLGMYAILLLYRAFVMERQLFRGEKKRTIIAGILCLVLLALFITADVTLPYKDWHTAWYSSDREEAMMVYEDTFDRPAIHGESAGVPFYDDESVAITHTHGPMGDCWELEYHYGKEKATYGDMGVGSMSVLAPSVGMARRAAAALVDGMDRSGHDLWPDEGLTPVDIDWADEAWHCRWQINSDGGTADVLVVRAGNRVARIVLPADLMREESLSAVRAELMK